MKRKHFFCFLLCCLFGASFATAQITQATINGNGIDCRLTNGLLRVEFVASDIVRVQYTPELAFCGNGTAVCIPRTPTTVRFSHNATGDSYRLQSDSLVVVVNKQNGAVSYREVDGTPLLQEDSAMPRTYQPTDSTGHLWKYSMNFQLQPDEAIYGLGSHEQAYMNLRGKTLYLCQHNLKVMIPVLNSTAGYGLLADAGCAMLFTDTTHVTRLEMEAARQIDYYFMKGRTLDAVVANYRLLTGDVPMMPRYLFGYTQSKERYVSSDDLINTLKEYRTRRIPIDMIVQDWNYWPNGQWGTMSMNPEFYPDKKALADEIHRMNAKLMISVWPNPQGSPQTDDFRSRGFMLPGDASVYDAFNPLARGLYWQYANNEFFSNGFDAWWCDSSEPVDADWSFRMPQGYSFDSYRQRWELNTNILSNLLGAERSQLYSLYHAMGIYENQRATTNAKRVVNLTRSSYAGQQRYSTISWNGDVSATWQTFAQMIPAGLNYMATGSPYWTVDIGGFFAANRRLWYHKGDYPQGVADMGYRELYTRMFQYAAFLPVFRSHGSDTPREVWRFGNPGEPFYESLMTMIRLRYRLLPYVYTLAGRVHNDNYTITRALAFDFARDAKVVDLKDEFMFGPSLLVAPVTTPMYYTAGSVALSNVPRTRTVYLPQGARWTDFWTGKNYAGGTTVTADAPIERIPLFVRQGSIIPMGPVVQYSSEQPDAAWEVRIYPGRDTSFTVYEDEGDNYNYEQGASSTYTMKWNDRTRTLTLSAREGNFPGMTAARKLRLVVVGERSGLGVDEATTGGTVITYSGKEMAVKL
jgi:alpha-D-xyloside xylohydrolase